MNYETYITSKAWAIRKRLLYQKRGYHCERCGDNRSNFINVHHATYERLGDERDGDLFILCRNCHAEYHALFGKEPDIHSTRQFLTLRWQKPRRTKPKPHMAQVRIQQLERENRRLARKQREPAVARARAERASLKREKVQWAIDQMKRQLHGDASPT